MLSETETDLGVQFIGLRTVGAEGLLAGIPPASFHQDPDCAVAEEPDAGIDHIEAAPALFSDLVRGRLLQVELEFFRVCAITEGDTELGCLFRFNPEAEDDDIGAGHGGQVVCEADEDISAGDQDMGRRRGGVEEAGEWLMLKIEEGLGQGLSEGPAEYGNGGKDLTDGGVGGKASTLTSSMDNQGGVLTEPLEEGGVGVGFTPGLMKQVSGGSARTDWLSGRIGEGVGDGAMGQDCRPGVGQCLR